MTRARSLSLRNRFAAISAGAVALAVAVALTVVFIVTRTQLRSQIDDSLAALARLTEARQDPVSGLFVVSLNTGPLSGDRAFAQFVPASGTLDPPSGTKVETGSGNVVYLRREALIPVSERARAVADGSEPAYYEDREVGDTRVRVYTRRVLSDLAVQVARPLDEVEDLLGDLTIVLLALFVGGTALAALLGRAVAGAALTPVRRLTAAAEHVSATRDLTSRIEAGGSDELSRLATTFNSMLEALEVSVINQRRLVADASHELRTPLTSVRTNMEVLARGGALDAEERERIVEDVVAQLEELTILVGDLVEAARGNEPLVEAEELRFDEVVERAVALVRARAARVTFKLEVEPCILVGRPARLERAVSNLLDNALKWSPRNSVVEVEVRDCALTVRDHGPGIEEADLERVFDRFYRSPSARSAPGSGLGLAIVRDVAETHGGRVTARTLSDGGALFTLDLKGATPPR